MSNGNDSESKLVLKAELKENKVILDCYTKHIPTLAYIEALIQAEKIKLIIHEKAKEEQKNAPIVQGINSLRDFLRRR